LRPQKAEEGELTSPTPSPNKASPCFPLSYALPRAVEVNIAIMRTFVQLRSLMQSNKLLAEKIEKLEEKYDQNFQIVFDAINQLIAADEIPNKELGFHTINPS
jgi:hypothetical protein